MAARRRDCSDDERGRRHVRAGNTRTMTRRSRSWERILAGVGFSLLACDGAVLAADLPLKATVSKTVYDWTGFYVGGHFGYAAGDTGWTATEAGAAGPSLNGAFDLFKSYDPF